MQINGYGDLRHLRRSAANGDAGQAAGRAKPAPEADIGAAPAGADGDAVSISPLGRHLAKLRNMPEVRDTVVAEMKDRLSRGELVTPEALARGTAEMIKAALADEL